MVAVEEAHAFGRKVMSHAQGREGIENSILAGVDSIEHGFCLDEELVDMMLKRGVFFVPTLVAGRRIVEHADEVGIPDYAQKKAEAFIHQHREAFHLAHQKGVQIAMGTDAGTPYNMHGQNASEITLMVQAGMKPEDALDSATRMASDLMGMRSRVGTLATGLEADLVAVSGDFLDDVSVLECPDNILMVMKQGRIIKEREV